MDRSTTPKVSQMQQSRRQKNRSRSGSEELRQILTQGAGVRPNSVASPSMSASSSSSGFSTPLTANATEPPLARTNSPRLLGWVRSAFLSSPASRSVNLSPNLTTTVPLAQHPPLDEEEDGEGEGVSGEGIEISRNSTPLLPGIVPQFHRRQSDSRDDALPSARSSFSIETPSRADKASLEPTGGLPRRFSSVSTTSTMYDEDHSSESEEEDVYAPFAPKQHGPSLIRPTARREAIPLGRSDDEEDEDEQQGPGVTPALGLCAHSAQDSRLGVGISHASSGQELHLSIGEAQDSRQFVSDLTPFAANPPSVVLTPPDASPLASQVSPLAGWMEPALGDDNQEEKREDGDMRASISANRTPVPRDFHTTTMAEGERSTDSSSGVSFQSAGSRSKGQTTSDLANGDGEDLDDVLGRPRSPEEVAKNRPSKESVVLGSRGASTRAGQKKSKKTGKKDVEDKAWDDMRSKTPMAAPSLQQPTAPANEVGVPTQTASPQPRRAMNFFSRRREVSSSALQAEEETGEGSKVKREAGQTTFWRLGKRQGAGLDANAQAEEGKQTDGGKGRRPSHGSDVSSGDKSLSRVSSRATTAEAASVKTKESWGKRAATKGALSATMEPRAIKVRSRNKSAKDRDFARVYLAQELFLGERRKTSASISQTPSSDNLALANETGGSAAKVDKKPPLSHLDSSSSLASSATSSSVNSLSANQGGKRRATWAMKFSLDGKHLAVAGQDAVIRVYAVLDSEEARKAVELEASLAVESTSAGLGHQDRGSSCTSLNSAGKGSTGKGSQGKAGSYKPGQQLPNLAVFAPKPVKEFKGHTNDILDLSWSKGGFLLSASMDKTARVWHLSWQNSLVSFVHGDFVTSAAFHPRDDRFFLSGSLDGKLRLWNISSKKVQCSQEVPGLITACAFTESGNTACVGTFAGHALFYQTDGLSYSSSIAVRSPSGKNAKGGRKITCIEPLQSSGDDSSPKSERVLITSNDSRVRAYDLRDKSMLARFKAKTYTNRTSQIRAGVSNDNAFIVAGSEASSNEGGQVHIWDASTQLSESSKSVLSKMTSTTGSASTKGRSSSSPLSSDSAVEYFTAHAGTVTCAIMAPLTTNSHLKASLDHILLQSDEKLVGNSISSGGGGGGGSSAGLSALGTMSLSNAISAAVPNQLKFGSGNNGQLGFHRKLNRIIVSVDESAVVRVWRSDSLNTVDG